MKSCLTTALGLAVMLYLFYVVVESFKLIVGWSDIPISEMVNHYVFIGVVIFLNLLLTYFSKNRKSQQASSTSEQTSQSSLSFTFRDTFNPYEDIIHPAVYQQKFKTWWYTSDSEEVTHSYQYGTLRFYEDGIVIGNRNAKVPKLNLPESFGLKGTWEVDQNKVTLSLEKTTQEDDTIQVHIREEHKREMKYYGEIADDNSIIKAGKYSGKVKGDTIRLGDFQFNKVKTSTLIITADDGDCSRLQRAVEPNEYVISTYEDSGFWYTNGETGPEWFTLHIKTFSNATEIIDQLVSDVSEELGISIYNHYWS